MYLKTDYYYLEYIPLTGMLAYNIDIFLHKTFVGVNIYPKN